MEVHDINGQNVCLNSCPLIKSVIKGLQTKWPRFATKMINYYYENIYIYCRTC